MACGPGSQAAGAIDVTRLAYVHQGAAPAGRTLLRVGDVTIGVIGAGNQYGFEWQARHGQGRESRRLARKYRALGVGHRHQQGGFDLQLGARRPVGHQQARQAMSDQDRLLAMVLDAGLERCNPVAARRAVPISLFNPAIATVGLLPMALPVIRPRVSYPWQYQHFHVASFLLHFKLISVTSII
ncbi:hypothetical protein D3C86_1391160 [compost metagenome]